MACLSPLGEYVAVRRIESESVSRGGIVIPDGAKEKPQRAIVLAVGPGKLSDRPMVTETSGNYSYTGPAEPTDRVKPGDEVLFAKYAGSEFKIDGQEVTLLKESDLLARIVEGDWPVPSC
jgi:chaperonin GroES